MFSLKCLNIVKLMREKRALEAELKRARLDREAWSIERQVLVQEISRNKHMIGVYQKLFKNLDIFNSTFHMVHMSIGNLVSQAVCDPRYATVAELELLKVEHLMFKLGVYRKFLDLNGPDVTPYDECTFGRWYAGDGQKLSSYPEFQELEQQHRSLHVYAAEAIQLFKEENYLEGVDKVTRMEQSSVVILGILDFLAMHLLNSVSEKQLGRPTDFGEA